ncbi:MAG: DUF1178 family protein [Alphaproteobacteria bacterium]
MIRYALICGKAHEFEAWFSNSSSYDEQVAARDVACPHCGSTKIAKAPMAPSVARSGKSNFSSNKAIEALRRARNEMLKDADNVGDNFAREARKIHYKDTEPRGIYGRASDKETKALREEGVDFSPLPVLPEDHN